MRKRQMKPCVIVKERYKIPVGTTGVATYPINSSGNIMFYPKDEDPVYCICIEGELIEWK